MNSTQTSALKGVRIIDFTHVYQGPVGTQLLADHGAEVIKVEKPGGGDWSRSWGPFVKGVSLPFANLNRNKRSLAIDLRQASGKEIINKLISTSDILVHNFRKDAMDRLGLSYSTLKTSHPKLIYAWSSGWGDSGPDADRGRPGHDMMARAEAGWFSHQVPGRPPIASGISIDYAAGLNLMIAILAALHHREKTGQGQMVSTDLLSVAFHGHAWEGANSLNEEKIDQCAAIGGTEAAIDRAFETLDGYIEISAVFSDNALKDISTALGLGDLSLDERFATQTLQMENRTALNNLLAGKLREKSTESWLSILEAKGVLCARIKSFREAMDSSQIAANKMIVQMEHRRAGRLNLLGSPIRMHTTPASLVRPPPDLGEHNDEILGEIGYSPEQIKELRSSGAIV